MQYFCRSRRNLNYILLKADTSESDHQSFIRWCSYHGTYQAFALTTSESSSEADSSSTTSESSSETETTSNVSNIPIYRLSLAQLLDKLNFQLSKDQKIKRSKDQKIKRSKDQKIKRSKVSTFQNFGKSKQE